MTTFQSLGANKRLQHETRNSKSEIREQRLAAHFLAIFGFRASSLDFRISNFGSRIGALLACLAAILLLASPVVARAQGCAMCYTSAASAHAAAIQALRSGVLILLVPPLVMMAVILVVVYRCRNRFNTSPLWTVEDEREWKEMLAGAGPGGRNGLEVSSLLSVASCPLQRTTDNGQSALANF